MRLKATTHAFLQGDGSWGWSNAGLVVGEREALLVDTFFDLALTRRLLAAVGETAGVPIRTLVNTHHNGDHCYGNQLVQGATIVGHRNCRDEMVRGGPPTLLAGIRDAPGDSGAIGYLRRVFAPFDFSGIEIVPPQVVFDDEHSVALDGRELRLLHFGPGHTLGDIVVWVPDEGVLYAGDLLFCGSTPLVWEGSLTNWMRAIDAMAALGPEVVVPGHGPVTDVDGLREMRGYLERVVALGRGLKAQGFEPLEAARRFDPGPYRAWLDSERIVLNFMRLWLELDGQPPETRVDAMQAFAGMAELASSRQ